MTSAIIDFLSTRRSVVAKKMLGEPPTDEHLQQIINCGLRVPDHSNVQPWRIVMLTGDARREFGQKVVVPAAEHRYSSEQQVLSDEMRELEAARMTRGGTVITVLSTPVVPHKIPLWEQQLSSAAVCMQLINAAQALDYAAQWITEWLAFDNSILEALGGNPQFDQIAGFIHIAKKHEQPSERSRPDATRIVSHWQA